MLLFAPGAAREARPLEGPTKVLRQLGDRAIQHVPCLGPLGKGLVVAALSAEMIGKA